MRARQVRLEQATNGAALAGGRARRRRLWHRAACVAVAQRVMAADGALRRERSLAVQGRLWRQRPVAQAAIWRKRLARRAIGADAAIPAVLAARRARRRGCQRAPRRTAAAGGHREWRQAEARAALGHGRSRALG
eukprot:124039-Chlamydomonas_euryale.AAC.3